MAICPHASISTYQVARDLTLHFVHAQVLHAFKTDVVGEIIKSAADSILIDSQI